MLVLNLIQYQRKFFFFINFSEIKYQASIINSSRNVNTMMIAKLFKTVALSVIDFSVAANGYGLSIVVY